MSKWVTLSLVWFFLLGGLGFFFPYYSLYLDENGGLSGSQVGIVMAIPPLMGVLVQPFWGQVADRSGSRSRILALLGLCAALGYLGLSIPSSFEGFLVATAAFALFGVALIPSAVSVTLALTRERGGAGLGRVRVWGTVGFGVSVCSFPFLLGRFQSWRGLAAQPAQTEPGFELIFPLAAGLVALAALLSLGLPRGGAEAIRARRDDWRQLLRHGPFLRLLAFTFLGFLFLQGPIVLFPILVRAQGGDLHAIARMWLLMLALEVPLVALLGRSVSLLGVRGVIAIGMTAGAVRWLVSGFSHDLTLVTTVQLLHGVVVWGVILGVPLYVDRVVPERLRSTGQGLMAMIGVSIGGMLSNLCAGWLIDRLGATAPAQVGGMGALLLVCLLPWLLPPPRLGEAERA